MKPQTKFQILSRKQIQKNYHKNFVKKSEIRKQKLNIRKKYSTKKFTIKFEVIFRLLKKLRPKGKILGGYYPYNNEIDVLDILKRFEKKKL